LARGATIYAEVLGGNVNSGGQRGLGTMTAQIRLQYKVHTKCFENAGVGATENTINGI
jgi:hypothetical protein